MCAKLLQLRPTFCNPMDCSPPGSSVHGILQARTLEWVAISFIFPTHIYIYIYMCVYMGIYIYIYVAKSLQSCPTLCDPIEDSLPGSPLPGIFQARTLEWVAISFSNA